MLRTSGRIPFTVLLVAFVAAAGLTFADTATIGHVKKSSGEAHILRGGERLPATPGTSLQVGDGIETGADGRLGITMADNTMFAAGPNTRMTFDDYSFDSNNLTGNALADLQQGTLSVVSGEMTKVSPDALKVKTPRAILGVRGTELFVRVGGADQDGR